MGKNLIRKVFDADGTWTCPAGVTQVKALAEVRNYAQLATGADCGFATLITGDLYGWGGNATGQLGIGDVAARSSPILVLGAFKWRQVAAGNPLTGSASYGIDVNGNLYAWGYNAVGQLGTNDVTPRSSPVIVVGGLKWRQVAAGISGAVGIDSTGVAYAWGANANGQLGDGTVVTKSSPVLVLGGKTWLQVAAGNSHYVGLDTAGNLYAWGLNANGQLGVGDVTPRSSPVLVLGGKTWKMVACGDSHVVAIDSLFNVYAWGANGNGQLGVGDVTPRSSPVLVVGSLKWRYIAAGINSNIGVTTAGDAYSWGYNAVGQLGDNTTTPRSSPVLVVNSLKWRQVAMGGQFATGFAMGISTTGYVYTWGYGGNGQLASGAVSNRASPVVYNGNVLQQNPTVYDFLANSRWFDVVPGTTYQVSVQTTGLGNAMFNYSSLYQDPYGNPGLPLRVTLEYQG